MRAHDKNVLADKTIIQDHQVDTNVAVVGNLSDQIKDYKTIIRDHQFHHVDTIKRSCGEPQIVLSSN